MAKEYIERGEAIAAALEQLPVCYEMDAVESALMDIPAADVRPVVRCKDCLNWKRDAYGGVYDRYGVRLDKDWFCAGGEMREIDDED